MYLAAVIHWVWKAPTNFLSQFEEEDVSRTRRTHFPYVNPFTYACVSALVFGANLISGGRHREFSFQLRRHLGLKASMSSDLLSSYRARVQDAPQEMERN